MAAFFVLFITREPSLQYACTIRDETRNRAFKRRECSSQAKKLASVRFSDVCGPPMRQVAGETLAVLPSPVKATAPAQTLGWEGRAVDSKAFPSAAEAFGALGTSRRWMQAQKRPHGSVSCCPEMDGITICSKAHASSSMNTEFSCHDGRLADLDNVSSSWNHLLAFKLSVDA
jgi:hypothetical protein